MMHDRYTHSAIDACVEIHDDITGAGDPLPDERRLELVDWLRRRLRHWKNTPRDFHPSTCDYDHAVRLLMRATLDMHDERVPRASIVL